MYQRLVGLLFQRTPVEIPSPWVDLVNDFSAVGTVLQTTWIDQPVSACGCAMTTAVAAVGGGGGVAAKATTNATTAVEGRCPAHGVNQTTREDTTSVGADHVELDLMLSALSVECVHPSAVEECHHPMCCCCSPC